MWNGKLTFFFLLLRILAIEEATLSLLEGTLQSKYSVALNFFV
jgi:hypothetical protein